MQELKVRIHDWESVEKQLLSLGAIFREERLVEDTYFNQPAGHVLKIARTNKGSFIQKLQAKAGGFEILKNEPLEDPNAMKKELTEKHGVKRVLHVKRRFYEFHNYTILLNIIDQVGEFLIVTGEQVSKEIIADTLGIKNPEYITVSFDEL